MSIGFKRSHLNTGDKKKHTTKCYCELNQYQDHNSYFPWQHLHANWTLGMVGMFWTLMLLFNKFPQRGAFLFWCVQDGRGMPQ